MSPLLIHADPGARSGFVAAWLQKKLKTAGFDVGKTTDLYFEKIHCLSNENKVRNFHGQKIRIRPSYEKLYLHLLLFLKKNVQTQISNFSIDEFSLETFSKVYVFAKECFEHDQAINYSLYNCVLKFSDTFDIEKMIALYCDINGHDPCQEEIELALKNNELNQIEIDPNHACNIAAMVLETEHAMKLCEKNRLWSLPMIYNSSTVENLYNEIKSAIIPENYQKES